MRSTHSAVSVRTSRAKSFLFGPRQKRQTAGKAPLSLNELNAIAAKRLKTQKNRASGREDDAPIPAKKKSKAPKPVPALLQEQHMALVKLPEKQLFKFFARDATQLVAYSNIAERIALQKTDRSCCVSQVIDNKELLKTFRRHLPPQVQTSHPNPTPLLRYRRLLPIDRVRS